MNANLGLKPSARSKVLALLDATLADEYVLYTKTRNFHWNVVGPDFNEMHKFFEAQYETLNRIVDEVAERSRALDGRSLGSLAEFAAAARLKESVGRTMRSELMLRELLRDHEALIRSLRADVDETARLNDAATVDFLTGLLGEHEKMAWMLRSFVS